MPAVDDREIVSRCLNGDRDGLSAFVERFQSLVFAVCFRQVGRRHDAEDLTQETLHRAIRHLGNWDGLRPLKPWVLTIAVNRCRTYLSRRSAASISIDSIPEPTTQRKEPDQSGLSEEIQQALGQLREDYRTCFLLFHQQELGIQEISEIMDCPDGTIKTWLHRARKELAILLRERGFTGASE